MRRFASLLLTLVAFALPLAAQAPQSVGKVDRMIPAGFIARGTATNEAKPADPVVWNDILRTNDQGRMRIAMEDGSQLSIGAHSELRVVKHDTQSSQTVVEMLYGKTRATVVPVKKSGGSFQIRTPTAVIGVLGTTVEVETAQVTGTVTEKDIQELPASRRNVSDLAQLVPGTLPDKKDPEKPTIADYLTDGTLVTALDHTVGVRSIEPEILKTVVLLPGYSTWVPRGGPPTDPFPYEQRNQFYANPAVDRSTAVPELAQSGCRFPAIASFESLEKALGSALEYEVTGRGTSTGPVFEVHVKNQSGCPLNLQVPAGTILKPTGYTGRVIKGILLGGGMPPLKDFQVMMAEGGFGEIPPTGGAKQPAPWNFFLPPDAEETTFIVRGYCLELHKLAPHQKTKYKFADEDEQKKLSAPNLKVMEKAHQLYNARQIGSQLHSLDSIVQWSLWASREGMNAKKFHEEFFDLVEKNYKGMNKKWDKDAKASTERMAQDLWGAVEKVLAASR